MSYHIDKAVDFTKTIATFFAPAILIFIYSPQTFPIETKFQFILDYWIILVLIYLLYLTKSLTNSPPKKRN